MQESRVIARKPRDAAAVLSGLKFAPTTFTACLTGAKLRKSGFGAPKIPAKNGIKRKMAIQGHSKSSVLESVHGKAIRD